MKTFALASPVRDRQLSPRRTTSASRSKKFTKHDKHKQQMESYNKRQWAPTDNTNVRPISMITKQSIASMGMILPFQARVKASLHEVRRNCHCCDNHWCCRRTAAISTKILVQYLKVCTSVTLQTIRHNREPSLSRDLMPLYLLDDINNKAVAFVRFVVHDKTARSGQSKMAKQTSL